MNIIKRVSVIILIFAMVAATWIYLVGPAIWSHLAAHSHPKNIKVEVKSSGLNDLETLGSGDIKKLKAELKARIKERERNDYPKEVLGDKKK